MVPSAPIITGTTLPFSLHIFSSSFFISWYFLNFFRSSCHLILLLVLISNTCIILQYLVDWPVLVCLSGCRNPTGSPYSPQFSEESRIQSWEDSRYMQMFREMMPATWLFLSINIVLACILHLATRCWAVFEAFLYFCLAWIHIPVDAWYLPLQLWLCQCDF